MGLAQQVYDLTPIEKVRPHPDNPRRGDVDSISESIEANGFYGAVVAQRSTGHILAGNHRWFAAQAAGLAEVPVIWVDVDDDKARRILLADNRTNDKAGYDNAALLSVLEELAVSPEALLGTGYDPVALDDLRALAGDVEMLAPVEPRGDYAEAPGEEQDRVAHYQPGIHANGLREMILVFPIPVHDEALSLVRRIREFAEDVSTSDVVLACLRFATKANLDVREYLK